MNTSPRMQAFVTTLCQRHGVAITQAVAGDYLRLESPEGNANLLIEVLDEEQLAVGYTLWQENCVVMDMQMKFLVTPDGWEPVNVQDCFSRSWQEYWMEAGREGLMVFDETGLLILSSMAEYWADRLITWGWLRKGLLEDGIFAALTEPLLPAPRMVSVDTSHPTSVTETLTQASLF